MYLQIDELALQQGVEVLRLPPYHSILNPIELCWAVEKNLVGGRDTEGKLQMVERLFEVGRAHVSDRGMWKAFERKIVEVENWFWERDGAIEEEVEPVVVEVEEEEDHLEDQIEV